MRNECPRCDGFMVFRRSFYIATLRQYCCVNCGCVLDNVILANQKLMRLAPNNTLNEETRGKRNEVMITWLEVLEVVSKMDQPFKNVEVAEHFDMTAGEASSRLHKLRQWGFLNYADIKQKGWGGFVVTVYGFKRLEKEGKVGSK